MSVGRGRGEGMLNAVYVLKGRATRETKEGDEHRFILQFFIYVPKKDHRIKLGNSIEFDVKVVKPIERVDVNISPKADRYVVGDPVNLDVIVVSKYRGKVLLRSEGVVDTELTSSLDSGSNELNLYGVIKIADKVNVYISLPEIGYDVVVSRSFNVIDKRLDIKGIEVEGIPKLGEKAKLKVILANMSLISKTSIKIDANIYGYKIEKDIEINPNESCEIILETPTILTRASRENRRGTVVIKDMVSNQEFFRDLELPDPLPLNLVLKPVILNLRVPSCSIQRLDFLYIENKENKNVKIYLADVKPPPSVCSITIDDADLNPNSSRYIGIVIKPSRIGKEEVGLEFRLAIDNIDVELYQINATIDVYESFKVNGYTIVSPRSGYAVKNQRVSFKLDIDVLSNVPVKLEARCRGIELDTKTFNLNPGKNNVDIVGRTVDYIDSIELEVSDGIVRKKIDIPIKVVKPSVECTYEKVKLFKGLKKSIALIFAKKFEVPIELSIDIKKSVNIELLDLKRIKVVMEPHEREKKVVLNAIGIDVGKASIEFEVVSKYVDERNTEVDEWINKYVIDLEILMPIEINIVNKPSKILLPYPTKPIENKLKNILSSFIIELKNISDQILPKASINIYSGDTITVHVEPASASIEPTKVIKYNAYLSIPVNYRGNELSINLIVLNERYRLTELSIKIPVERYFYSIVKITKNKLVETCRYITIDGKDSVYLLLPLWETNIGI
ncbi:MAG: hypothetical protein QXZ41_08285, partial [Ignisphaera sp.]